MKLYIITLLSLLMLCNGCNYFTSEKDILGEWKYIDIKNLHGDPKDEISSEELKNLSPSIIFSSQGDLKIMWDNKLLSSGKYVLEGNIIRFTENLPEGKTRQFPFLILDIDDHTLKFQTMVQDATTVTAERKK
ncbi:MAG: hypothetical protein JWQ25_1936 [Daejeonella sp.]|nr:hypothetical protein [Daejeonella sp.]